MADDQKLIKEISKYSDQIGGFAGKYGNLVASCDGVGTKILLAQTAKKYHNRPLQSIGIDCVAMVVNDLLCKGAKPKFFLDYFAADRIREDEFYEILEGIHEGCVESEMELMGGETAELNGIITSDAFDVCGFGVGFIVDELPKDNIVVGDSVIGLKSSGFHSNGFTIIRQSLMDQNYMTTRSNEDMIDNFLEPTIIYVKDIELIRESGIKIKALAHITGGGLIGNLPRIIPKKLSIKLNLENLPKDNLFSWFKNISKLSDYEMLSTFNCGIGMALLAASIIYWENNPSAPAEETS